MSKLAIASRRTAALALSLLAAALAVPAAALAAPEEGEGVLVSSPSPIVLAPTTVGTQSAMQTVSLEYQGSGEVHVQKVTIEGPQAGEFIAGGSSCGGLTGGQQCDAWFALKPSSDGLKQATLKVAFVGLHAEESFEISGRGVPAEISLSPAALDFGLQRVNRDNSARFVQLSNEGEAGVQLDNLEISGDTGSFWWSQTNCWGTWLAPGQYCSIEVDFNPHEVRTHTAELRAWAHGASVSVALSGEGGRAIVAPTANPVELGTATVGGRGEVRSITLTNTGNLPETFFIAVVAGGDSGSFRLLDENCSGRELVPLATCTVQVRFEPLAPGPKAARLALFGDGDGGVMVELRGEGIAAAAQLLPADLDFGALAVGSRGPAREIAVRNDGGGPLRLDRVAIVGADVGQFAIVADGCTGATVAPGSQCGVRVRFAPDEAGEFAATLRVEGPAGTLTAALSGRGLEGGAGGESRQVSGGGAETAAAAPAAGDRAAGRATAKKAHRHRRFARNATIAAPRAAVPRRSGARQAGAKRRARR